ncbi:unnamed protein product [Mucor hiemalis]
MFEIDVTKASNAYHGNNRKSVPSTCYSNDDTDISEPDTALNTPTTGSMTYSFSRRYSSSSSLSHNSSSKSYPVPQRKLSLTPKSLDSSYSLHQQQASSMVEVLEKRVQALESELGEYVKREADLQSQVFMLTEKQTQQLQIPDRQYKSTLTRISKKVEKFLVTHENTSCNNKRDSSICWTDENWVGNEIPGLYYDRQDEDTNVNPHPDDDISASTSTTIPIVLVYRLKAMMDNFINTTHLVDDPPLQSFIAEFSRTIASWQEFYHTKLVSNQTKKNQEQSRELRLLEALRKVVIKNKVMKRDHAVIIKKYKADMKSIVKEINTDKISISCSTNSRDARLNEGKIEELQNNFSLTRRLLESQIEKLENELGSCQDERDEYETTLEMVRREMETMLEELEDTRQQRLRYKTQASRLRTGLEAIQKRQAKRNNNKNTSDEDDSGNEEDEGTEAIRLMYNEAERQAVDLDRECKRQLLTLNSVRKDLKLAEDKYHSVQTEKNKEMKHLQRLNKKLSRDIEMLQIEKEQLNLLQQQQVHQTKTASTTDKEDDHQQYLAKIYALQIALKAVKSDAVIQRTRISQLERQSSLSDIDNNFLAGLQDFLKINDETTSRKNEQIEQLKQVADIVEVERKLWQTENRKSFQKKYDIDLLQVNRELRFLSCKLNEVEEEASVLKSRHEKQLSLLKYQISSEFEKKIHQLASRHQLDIRELENRLETMFQKNQTLQDESLVLYGRNMMMAHKLGKIA